MKYFLLSICTKKYFFYLCNPNRRQRKRKERVKVEIGTVL
jgi:hypothetical protein